MKNLKNMSIEELHNLQEELRQVEKNKIAQEKAKERKKQKLEEKKKRDIDTHFKVVCGAWIISRFVNLFTEEEKEKGMTNEEIFTRLNTQIAVGANRSNGYALAWGDETHKNYKIIKQQNNTNSNN